MRFLATWLMVLCVLAGLNSRLMASSCNDATRCEHRMDLCCDDGAQACQPVDSHRPGDKCPPDHHHHHTCCSHVVALGLDQKAPCHLGTPVSALETMRHQGDRPPDEPFLGSEKPPLI